MLPNLSLGNFTLEVETQDDSDSFDGDMAQGVLFRAQDDTHFYAVLIDPRKKEYTVRKLAGENRWSDLVPWTASAMIEQEDGVNHLRIDAVGNAFTLFLNDDRLDSFSDSSYTKGAFGFIASNVDAEKPHSHFDNLKVFSTEIKPVTIEPAALPNTGDTSGVLPFVLGGLAFVLLGVSLRRREQGR
jgi:LPXTG-motif cell wall-anchored protein